MTHLNHNDRLITRYTFNIGNKPAEHKNKYICHTLFTGDSFMTRIWGKIISFINYIKPYRNYAFLLLLLTIEEMMVVLLQPLFFIDSFLLCDK